MVQCDCQQRLPILHQENSGSLLTPTKARQDGRSILAIFLAPNSSLNCLPIMSF